MDAKNTPLWTKDFIVLFFINFFVALIFYLLMAIITKFAITQFGSPTSEAGFASGIFVIGVLLARLFLGRVIARVGNKWALYGGMVLGLAATASYLVISNITLLYAIRFIHGISFGITTTTLITVAANVIPKEKSGEGIGYFGLGQPLATAFGPFLGMFISEYGNFSTIFATCALLAAISLGFLLWVRIPEVELTKAQQEEMKRFKLSNFFELAVLPVSAVLLMVCICYVSVVAFLAVYAQEIHLEGAASFYFMVYAAVIIISRPLVGKVFDKRGENLVMYSVIPVLALGMLVLSQTDQGYLLLLSGAMLGLGMGAIQPSTQTIVVKMTQPHRLGIAFATYFMCADIGMALGPTLAGLAIPFAGYRGTFLGIAILGALSFVVYYFAHGRNTGKRQRPGEAQA